MGAKRALFLTNAMVAFMIEHALREYPREACGLLGGRGEQVFEVRALRNVDASPSTRYSIDPEEQWRTFCDFEQRGWELVGIYHSHPAGPSHPSATDIAESYYPDAVYLIISLARRATPEITAWMIQEGRAEPARWQLRND